MKYARLTKRISKDEEAFLFHSGLHEGIERLAELEDKIESGELISTKETGDTEIEFFVKHNQIVRKTAIKQFAKDLKEKEQSIKVGNEWVAIITDKDIDELLHKRYSIRLEEEADND